MSTVVTTEYRVNDQGQKVRVTRTVRKVMKQSMEHVQARKQWSKFGQAAQKHEEDVTALGEEIILKLGVRGAQQEDDKPDKTELTVQEQVKKIQSNTIKCRVCKGDHFTARCPYKDTLTTIGAGEPESTPTQAASTPSQSNKYVPPSQRKGGAASQGTPTPSDGSTFKRDDTYSLRVSNLSDEAVDNDLFELFQRFGPLQRVYVARDREQNRCKGYAFVSFKFKEHAQKAMEKMNGHRYDSLVMQVEWSER